jgi:hypothetical protein
MLAQTPVVCEFDLADDKWDHRFLPHDLAMAIVRGFPHAPWIITWASSTGAATSTSR